MITTPKTKSPDVIIFSALSPTIAAIIRAIAIEEISGKTKSTFLILSLKRALAIIPSPTGRTITFTIDINIATKETSTRDPAIM